MKILDINMRIFCIRETFYSRHFQQVARWVRWALRWLRDWPSLADWLLRLSPEVPQRHLEVKLRGGVPAYP